MPYRVTFVCTGNICRSPMAEHVLRGHLGREGLGARVEVDSSGTGGWHVGDPADHRTVRALRRHGYTSAHRARRFQREWFDSYDLVLALDTGHLQELRRQARGPQDTAKLRLLRSFDPAAGTRLDVPDPYYGGSAEFEHVLGLIEAAMPALIARIRQELELAGPDEGEGDGDGEDGEYPEDAEESGDAAGRARDGQVRTDGAGW